jgi:aldose 1-epimerase
MLELISGPLRLIIDPEEGAAIRSFDLVRGEKRVPVLSAAHSKSTDAGESALFPMAPFANRIRGNLLPIGGGNVALKPNGPDPLCLHGWAWQRGWDIAHAGCSACRLELSLRDHGMDIRLSYAVELNFMGLFLSLSASNNGTSSCPAGLGFHPYFPRHADTTVRFKASDLWAEGPGHLPIGRTEIPADEEYSAAAKLPCEWRNQCYSGWDGTAEIRQPSLGYDIALEASGGETLMFYANPALQRFALEPQNHVSGETGPGPYGLPMLSPSETKRLEMTLTVHPRIGLTGTIESDKAKT